MPLKNRYIKAQTSSLRLRKSVSLIPILYPNYAGQIPFHIRQTEGTGNVRKFREIKIRRGNRTSGRYITVGVPGKSSSHVDKSIRRGGTRSQVLGGNMEFGDKKYPTDTGRHF